MTDRGNQDRAYGHLARALRQMSASVAVVGMGYVGVPLTSAFVEAGGRAAADVAYHDPLVAALNTGSNRLHSVPWEAAALARFDAAIICTDHDTIDYSLLASSGMPIVDTRNAMARRGFVNTDNIVKA